MIAQKNDKKFIYNFFFPGLSSVESRSPITFPDLVCFFLLRLQANLKFSTKNGFRVSSKCLRRENFKLSVLEENLTRNWWKWNNLEGQVWSLQLALSSFFNQMKYLCFRLKFWKFERIDYICGWALLNLVDGHFHIYWDAYLDF